MSEIIVLQIRYDGLDAEAHELHLGALGESLQVVARIISVTGNFVVTGRYVSKAQAMDVRVVAREPKANCFSIDAVLQFVQQQGLLQGGIGALLASIVALIVAKASNNKDEMKFLASSLDKAIDALAQGNVDSKNQLLAVVDRMVDALRPAAKQMVAPVGKSCRQMQIGDAATIDEPTAEAIRGEDEDEVDKMREYVVLITELDLENRTAKVRPHDQENRVRAVITDPGIEPYASAFVDQRTIRVSAKAVLRRGEIRSLYVSNILD